MHGRAAAPLQVTLHDHNTYTAKVIGFDAGVQACSVACEHACKEHARSLPVPRRVLLAGEGAAAVALHAAACAL